MLGVLYSENNPNKENFLLGVHVDGLIRAGGIFSNFLTKKKKTNFWNITVKFLFGGSAGMAATCFVQPLDLVKTRMQVENLDYQN